MCKRKLGIFLVIASCVCLTKGVDAACDYETQNRLKSEAANIRAVNEIKEIGTGSYSESEMMNEDGTYETYEITKKVSEVNIYNVTENLYVVVKNKNTNLEKKYYYKDTDNGTITWNEDITEELVEYEIKIYSNVGDCQNTELKNTSIVLPKYNIFSMKPYCYNVDAYYCEEYVTQEINMTEEEIENRGYKYQIENQRFDETEPEKEKKFGKYMMIIIASAIVLVIGGITILIVKRKQRSDVL